MSSNVVRPSTNRAWLATPVITGLLVLLTGCASHDPATASPHPTNSVSCPAGTHPRGGECLNNTTTAPANPTPDASPTCPAGTHLRAGECLNNVRITTATNS
jgi:hypothetical protein